MFRENHLRIKKFMILLSRLEKKDCFKMLKKREEKNLNDRIEDNEENIINILTDEKIMYLFVRS